MSDDQHLALTVPPDADGQRLDKYLTRVLEMSRSQVRARIDAGDVQVDGAAPSKSGIPILAGAQIAVRIPPPPPSTATPEDLPLDVVYEDDDLVIINKAPDMVVHPSPGHETGTLVNALVHRYGSMAEGPASPDGRPRPGIVHRLDRGTSGVMITARTGPARERLTKMLAERTVHRRYLAVVHGHKLADEGTFETMHGRHPKDRKKFSSKVREGRKAVTHWTVLARGRYVSLVECKLDTGRTHQIRVHFADVGHPLVGDDTYAGRRRAPGAEGRALNKLSRQALHAWKLDFEHPITQEPVSVAALPPEDLSTMIRSVFGADVWADLEAACSMRA
jgi:23S rRNA pseudouridine1911/1915/1917 synthase